MKKKSQQYTHKWKSIIKNSLTEAQRNVAESVIKSVEDTPISIRVIRWGDEMFAFEMTQDCNPVGYIKVLKSGKAYKCNNITKNKPIGHYLEKGKWTPLEIKE